MNVLHINCSLLVLFERECDNSLICECVSWFKEGRDWLLGMELAEEMGGVSKKKGKKNAVGVVGSVNFGLS